MNRPYRAGEIVLMNRNGWLRAYKVVTVHSEWQGDVETVEYTLQPVDKNAGLYQWQKPVGLDGS